MVKIAVYLLSILGPDRAKDLLWNLLGQVLKGTYKPGGEGEDYLIAALDGGNEGFTVIDVGANVGNWSRKFLDSLPNSKIHAIGAIPDFQRQIGTQELVTSYNLALSNCEKEITVFQSGGGGKPFEKRKKGKPSKKHTIRATTGDNFLAENGINSVDFIKIDTDGFDYEVLMGFSETISNHQPYVQFEVSYWWLRMGYTLKQAEKFFAAKGYILKQMTDAGLIDLRLDIPESLFITANIFAIPSGRTLPT